MAGGALDPRKGGKAEQSVDCLLRPAAGLEAEFTLIIDDEPTTPEREFGDPRGFLGVPLMHRTGRSYHLPTGAAIYFDTGVIELATPVVELTRGCFARLARLLEESLALVRAQLDRWEQRTHRRVRLQGFSAHYNVSPRAASGAGDRDAFERQAWLLAHILPAPVMLLAANPLSTGVGVRPRAPRLEITVDYSPDPLRIAATGALIAGIIVAVSEWASFDRDALEERRIPVITRFAPMPHTSRRGWLARYDCYPANPFACDPDGTMWETSLGPMTLRAIARRVWELFHTSIRRLAEPMSYALARAIVQGRSTSWLDSRVRPSGYDDVGRGGRRRIRALAPSAYEQIVRNAVARLPLELDDRRWVPERVSGWSRVVLRAADGRQRVMTLDELIELLGRWR